VELNRPEFSLKPFDLETMHALDLAKTHKVNGGGGM